MERRSAEPKERKVFKDRESGNKEGRKEGMWEGRREGKKERRGGGREEKRKLLARNALFRQDCPPEGNRRVLSVNFLALTS